MSEPGRASRLILENSPITPFLTKGVRGHVFASGETSIITNLFGGLLWHQ